MTTTSRDIAAGDWVPLYEALVSTSELDVLREGGWIHCGWERQRADRLLAEARRAGLDAHGGFYADAGYYDYCPGSTRTLIPDLGCIVAVGS